MADEHTPGPWVPAPGTWHVVASDGGSVCMVDRALRIATEADANARLIAAAPDLLVALTAAVAWAAPMADAPMDSRPKWFDQARVALMGAVNGDEPGGRHG